MILHNCDTSLQKKVKVKRIHYISGITISIFIALHLFNHLCSLIDVQSHIEVMNMLRLFYRNIVAELILLSAVIVQIVSGIKLFNGKVKIATGFFEKLQIWSGLYLAIFFVFHLGAVFMGRLILDLDTNIYFGAAGLNTFPFALFFVPYYGLAIISFFGHIAAVHKKRMKYTLLGIQPDKQAYLILTTGILTTLLILYGLTNGFMGIEIPKEYGVMTGN